MSLLHAPPAQGKYDALKQLLLQCYVPSARERAEKLLSHMELGDGSPVELMESMLFLVGADDGSFFFAHLFLKKLPALARAVLVNLPLLATKDYRALAEEADCIILANRSFGIQAVRPGSPAEYNVVEELQVVAGTATRKCRNETVSCVLVHSEPICDQIEFLHHNGTCVTCPLCMPGQQLSEDCGFGDGGDGVCIPCEDRKFSTETGVAPCRRCTQCVLLNRLLNAACSPTSDALCGQCLPGYYELRSLTGEVEPACIPCYKHDTVHKECLLLKDQGSNAQQFPEHGLEPESLLSAIDDQCTPPLRITEGERATTPTEAPSHSLSAEHPGRGLSLLSHENEMHPTSIVINVTTNIKAPSQNKDAITQAEQQSSITEEMERKLQTIWEVAQGHSIEMLDYDSVQDLSLLLDSTVTLRRLGRSLGVPPQVNAHLKGFQDLFQYLRSSTYTLLPQLAQAAALLPDPDVVARIHRAVVNK
ncbi:uncharacterized protein KZ484_008805 [Pholidichthys leucotaenia]